MNTKYTHHLAGSFFLRWRCHYIVRCILRYARRWLPHSLGSSRLLDLFRNGLELRYCTSFPTICSHRPSVQGWLHYWQMIKMSVMRYAKSRNRLPGTILTAFWLSGADPFEPDSDGIYEMKLPTHPPIATNIRDFGTPTFDFGIKPRKLNISTEANNSIGDVDAPDFEPGSDSIMTCYCGGRYNIHK